MEKKVYKGKVIAVTGSGRGIGRRIAETYADDGGIVVIAEKDQKAAENCANLINAGGGSAIGWQTDVSDSDSVRSLMKMISGRFGRLDILINNAGFGIWKSPLELSDDEWDDVVGTNLRGTFLCSREAARLMKETGGGVIVNIASTRALMSEPDSEAYAASKGGIVSLTHALAASLSAHNIRVNCISPGWIETGDYSRLKPSDHQQHFSGRVGRPDDIAQACLWLTDPANEFVNGSNIIIDGGMTRKMIYEP